MEWRKRASDLESVMTNEKDAEGQRGVFVFLFFLCVCVCVCAKSEKSDESRSQKESKTPRRKWMRLIVEKKKRSWEKRLVINGGELGWKESGESVLRLLFTYLPS